jgi:hypothetical protein
MKGYRTLLFNGLLIAAGVVSYLAGASLPAAWVIPVGIANVVLRMITTTPVGG